MLDTAETVISVAPRPARRGRWVADSLTLAMRSTRLTMRKPDALLTALLLPVMLMVNFKYLVGGAMSVGTDYIIYVVPGVFLAAAALGSSTTAVGVAADMSTGTIDRFRSMDVGGAPFLAGHVTASVLRNVASGVLVVAVAFPLGYRSHADALEWLGAIGMIMLLVLSISALAVDVGLLVMSTEAASSFTFIALFLPFTSSAFVPVHTMPGWLQVFSNNQPATPAIETIRALLSARSPGSHAWVAVAWWSAILLVCTVWAARLFQSRTK